MVNISQIFLLIPPKYIQFIVTDTDYKIDICKFHLYNTSFQEPYTITQNLYNIGAIYSFLYSRTTIFKLIADSEQAVY